MSIFKIFDNIESFVFWNQYESELSKKRLSLNNLNLRKIPIVRFLRKHINPTSKIEYVHISWSVFIQIV